MIPASAAHVIAALCLADPEEAPRALFVMLSLHELDKLFVSLVMLVADLVLLASLSLMKHDLAEAAILDLAGRAREWRVTTCLLILKDKRAVGGRAAGE